MNRLTRTLVVTAALVLPLTAACGAEESSSATPEASAVTQASEVSFSDPWIKAADSGMTAAFAEVSNSGSKDAVIVSADTAVSDRMELHEMATDSAGQMVMRPKEGGITIPANGSHSLAPGGDHLMLMNLTEPVKPGDKVSITLTFADGSKTSITTAARSFSGAGETYEPGMSGDMSGMDMSGSNG